MPRKSALKCYFGCIPFKGKLHHFPSQEYPSTEKFDQWKTVLREIDREKGANYIYNNIRICDHHFEGFYQTPSGRLTKNAVPTLNIGIPLHSFPNPDVNAEKFNTWIDKIGGEIAVLDNLIVFNNRRVCHKHFEDKDRYPSKRLTKIAIPALYLPDQLLTETVTMPALCSISGVQEPQTDFQTRGSYHIHEVS